MKPDAGELRDRLILSLVWLNRFEEAGTAAEAKLGEIQCPEVRDFLRAASLWDKVKNLPRAAVVLQVGLQIHPSDIALGRSMAELNRAAANAQAHSYSAIARFRLHPDRTHPWSYLLHFGFNAGNANRLGLGAGSLAGGPDLKKTNAILGSKP